MNEKVIGEKKKVNKKIIITLITIIALIGIILFLFLNRGKENKEEVYLTSAKEIAKQGQYLNISSEIVFSKLGVGGVTDGTKLSSLGAVYDDYVGCDGTVNIDGVFYHLSATCTDDTKDAYTIKQTLTKGGKMYQLVNIYEISGGYLFTGLTQENNGIVGKLNADGTIIFETEIALDSSNSIIMAAHTVSDGYIATIQTPINEEKSDIKIVKLDKNGKITKTNKINTEAHIIPPKSNFEDTVIFASDDMIYILNKNGDLVKEIEKSGITSISISNDTIYCIDSNTTIYAFDKNGNQKEKLEVLSGENPEMDFEVINNKYFILYNKMALMLNEKGEKIKTTEYSSLALPEEKRTENYEEGMNIGFYRKGNNLNITFLIDEYIVADKYDSNFELIDREIFQNDYLAVPLANYNLNIFLGSEDINFNYSGDHKLFIKTIYEKRA